MLYRARPTATQSQELTRQEKEQDACGPEGQRSGQDSNTDTDLPPDLHGDGPSIGEEQSTVNHGPLWP